MEPEPPTIIIRVNPRRNKPANTNADDDAETASEAVVVPAKKARNKNSRRARPTDVVPDTIERFTKKIVCVTFAPGVTKTQGAVMLSTWGAQTDCVITVNTSHYLCTVDDSETVRLLAELQEHAEEEKETVAKVELAELPPFKAVWHCTMCNAVFMGRPAKHRCLMHSGWTTTVAVPAAAAATAPAEKATDKGPRIQREAEEVPDTIEKFTKKVVRVTLASGIKKRIVMRLARGWSTQRLCVPNVKSDYFLCTADESETARLLAELQKRAKEEEEKGETGKRTVVDVALAELPPNKSVWHCTVCDAVFKGKPTKHLCPTQSEQETPGAAGGAATAAAATDPAATAAATTAPAATAPAKKGKKKNKGPRKPRAAEKVPDTIERFTKKVVCVTFESSVTKAQGFELLSTWGTHTESVIAMNTRFYLCTVDEDETTRLLAALEARAEEEKGTVAEVALAELPAHKKVWHCTVCGEVFEERPAEHERLVHSARAVAAPTDMLSAEDVAENSKRYADLHAVLARVEALQRSEGDGGRQAALRAIETALHAVYPAGKVHLYGSYVTGLWDEGSDMDVVIEVPAETDTVRALAAFLRSMRRTARGFKPFILRHTRIPLVHLDFTATDVACDVTCNNLNGCHNSALIRDYTTYDPRVRQYLLLVRAWGKRTGVINSKQGFMTAYSLVMLALVFVQVVHPQPLVPLATDPDLVARARAEAAAAASGGDGENDDVQPELELRHLADGFDYVHVHTWRTSNRAAPEELFHAFLAYYGYTFDFARDALDAQSGRIGPKADVAPGFGERPFVARDPFLRDFNMCQNISPNVARVILFNFRDSAHAIADDK